MESFRWSTVFSKLNEYRSRFWVESKDVSTPKWILCSDASFPLALCIEFAVLQAYNYNAVSWLSVYLSFFFLYHWKFQFLHQSVYSCMWLALVYREKGDTGAKKKKRKQKKKKDKSGGKDSAQDPLAKVRKSFLLSIALIYFTVLLERFSSCITNCFYMLSLCFVSLLCSPGELSPCR